MEFPPWVYEMLAAVDHYEEVHPFTGDPALCFYRILCKVPKSDMTIARSIAAYIRETNEPKESPRD